MTDLSGAFAHHAVATRYEDLSESGARAARIAIVDAVAAILAGSEAPGIAPVIGLAGGWNGPGVAFPFGDAPVSAPTAAMIMGAMARARDIDDVHDPTGDHPGIGAVIGAMVAAETRGGVPLEEVVTAVALAVDIVLRIRLAGTTNPARLPWTTGTYAPIAAAVAAGKIWKLDADVLQHALGNAFTLMSNTRQSSLGGALMHRVHHGMAISGGITAVQLAMAGVTGPRDSLDGLWGYYNAFEQGNYDREVALEGLGEDFKGSGVRVKFFTCCAHNHFAIQNALDLRAQNAFAPGDVVGVVARINERGSRSVCTPMEVKRNPRSIVDAQWSLPYTVAVALSRGAVFIDDFSADSIRDAGVLALAAKVTPVVTSYPDDDRVAIQRCPVEISLADGRVLASDLQALPGAADDPATLELILPKLLRCGAFAATPPSEASLRRFFEGVIFGSGIAVSSLVEPLWKPHQRT